MGGHIALALSQSGIGILRIVDPDSMLPGNVARHVAGLQSVGLKKARAVRALIKSARRGRIRLFSRKSPIAVKKYGDRIRKSDIAIDSTGNGALANALGYIAEKEKKPVVSGALYRGGAVGRVRRYALFPDADQPIHRREESRRYPAIPQGRAEDDFATPETGCSAPCQQRAARERRRLRRADRPKSRLTR